MNQYEHDRYSEGSHKQLRDDAGANAHEVNLRKKMNLDEFIQNAKKNDIRRAIAIKQKQENQKQRADILRGEMRNRRIQELHGASARNNREGRIHKGFATQNGPISGPREV